MLMLACAAAAQGQRLPPIDSCARDPSFVAFRTSLNAAIARHDAAFIRSILIADAFSEAGMDTGRAGFIRFWDLDHPARSRLWNELAAALRLGCARDRSGLAWVPSLSLDEDAPDDATHGGFALALPGAIVRSAPSNRGRFVAALRWDVISVVVHDPGQGPWAHVMFGANRGGYVRRNRIRLFTANHAIFQRVRGRWQLAGFAPLE
jgi:hypothetical protein